MAYDEGRLAALNLSISLDTLLLVIATGLIAYSTYLMYKATRQATLSQIKPVLIAWLREPEKGVGIYVQSVGNGTAFRGEVLCKTASGVTKYGFTRMWVGQVYEYPIAGQPSLALSESDKKLTIEMNYQDIDGNGYQNIVEADLGSQVKKGQV